jgi:ubiquinone/menaquinone biosynthesis C-methylase UbiE
MSLRARLFAMTYDRQMAKTERAQLRDLRHGLLASAAGEVIEVGGGTGANLSCYGPEVTSLTITEPESPMVRRLERRARERSPLAKILRAPAEDLPFQATTDALAALGPDGAAELLRSAGGTDVNSLARTWPVPVGFVTGKKA